MHASNPIPREFDLSAKALEFHIEFYVGVGWLEYSNFAARILRAYDAAHFVRRYGPSEVRCVRDHQPIHRPAISVAAFAKTFEELLVSKVACMPSHNLAQACADYLWEQDAALRSLGLERLSIKAGQATVAMTVLPAMVNGIGITHGGAIFTLADFGLFACQQRLQRTNRLRALQHFLFATDQARRPSGGDGNGSCAFRQIRHLRCQRDFGRYGDSGISRAFARHRRRTTAHGGSHVKFGRRVLQNLNLEFSGLQPFRPTRSEQKDASIFLPEVSSTWARRVSTGPLF